ncbi:Uncharacterised protein [Mycobacteroides abscessus subsp. abscessus]|uniref:hypothetical protein n=1 Tax=Mycobacteroides abscessus TaxID=36809 RepID=UPI0009A79134|nr:hypothetical protein [Mycobacteroides abscessus]SKQ89108.1 Uncharacterised protein [Mycobacteroides abscessus subsp. abscessus]
MAEDLFQQAWGADAPIIVGDEEIPLPKLPEYYSWLITRELTRDRTGAHPTYRVALLYYGPYDTADFDFCEVRSGLIDKTMYGEAGVRELAQRFVSESDLLA